MESIQKDHDRLWANARQSKFRGQAQDVIDALQRARDAIAEDPSKAAVTLAKLQNPIKTTFDAMGQGLKEKNTAQLKYGRALDRIFRDKDRPGDEEEAIAQHPALVNRAIYLHMLREGLFDVAATFAEETDAKHQAQQDTARRHGTDVPMDHPLGLDKSFPAGMEQQFIKMYHILVDLKEKHNLQPAIDWARQNSKVLEDRGSNLEFELCRLKYTILFVEQSPAHALIYAQTDFQNFRGRYMTEISQMLAAQAYASNLADSPYAGRFHNSASFDEVAQAFSKEFCSLLELSADSPLYLAASAGAIALPQLLKLRQIQKLKHTEWTSVGEMPVETPLPQAYQFHSIFVCPVSKEQTTDANPPMMLPCGHVIAQESMQRLSKGAKFKCPYCPVESHPNNARRVFL
ncbi:LisH domain-containing protein C29A3.03c [Cyphellophora attinorum]|uniref:GID complex catalytic subunit 2 n=1 Tax=Cyphellophora attinorum TaxID=1664694 RepID=A0A0N1HFF8_9EURO|nr:LisH domain-containing protein C29A3.03c [Phialophora attinorum]KPI44476.1 LisH domain-containing protein C29A3.03c [Phialophora attinorum]